MSDANAIERWKAPSFEHLDVEAASEVQAEPIDLAELQEQARAKGFELGKWEGMEKSWEEAHQEVKQITRLAEEVSTSFRGLDETVARELTKVAMCAARQIVRRELLTDSTVVEDLVEEALMTLSDLEGQVDIYVHPDDFKLVSKAAEQKLEQKLEGKSWKIMEDPDLTPGGCCVKTSTSFIDASVESRMEKVFAALAKNAEELAESE